jgi:hypothetical protein
MGRILEWDALKAVALQVWLLDKQASTLPENLLDMQNFSSARSTESVTLGMGPEKWVL